MLRWLSLVFVCSTAYQTIGLAWYLGTALALSEGMFVYMLQGILLVLYLLVNMLKCEAACTAWLAKCCVYDGHVYGGNQTCEWYWSLSGT